MLLHLRPTNTTTTTSTEATTTIDPHLALLDQEDEQQHYLLISHRSKNHIIDLCVWSKTTTTTTTDPSTNNGGASLPCHNIKNNMLMAMAVNVLNSCSSFSEIFTETKFYCPHCMLEHCGTGALLTLPETVVMSSTFTFKQVLDSPTTSADGDGDEGELRCQNCKQVSLPVEIIPELSLLPFGGDLSTKPPIVAEEISLHSSVVKYAAIPDHTNVLKLFTLSGVTFPALPPPCSTTPSLRLSGELGGIDGWELFHKKPILGDLLNLCSTSEDKNRVTTTYYLLLTTYYFLPPRSSFLIRQVPPIAHGDVSVENVIIVSLDDSGTEPFNAKIALHCGEERPVVRITTPQSRYWKYSRAPEFVTGSPPTTLEEDVWNFGLMVHQLMFPFTSSIEIQLQSPYSPTATTMTRVTVERFQLGRALALAKATPVTVGVVAQK
ncbi:hypothetical protein Pelo_17952 [Pelomyxa schiedti]|nr:hypothetical protein Pelo_17952 [Pelomyxa schiedti]